MDPSNNDYGFMSVNLNGTSYDNLVSLGYGTINPATLIDVSNTTGDKYLKLQGNHPDFQINIRIHESLWQAGSYTLTEGFGSTLVGCSVTFILNTDFDFEVEGDIEITEFNLTD